MDTKVKAMIKLIEEDADSFARRAEMYYKKRPELMKLVEEFYRAYRALAERYDYATVELRHAHRTMAEAFPNQVPYVLADESHSGSSGPGAGPHTPETPHPIRALLDPDDLHKDALGLSSINLDATKTNGRYSDESDSGIRQRGLKQLHEMFGSGEPVSQNSRGGGGMKLQHGSSQSLCENNNLRSLVLSEADCSCKAETEVQTLKNMLAEIQAEKEAVLLQYQQSLQKLSTLERELNHAQRDAGGLDEQASRADIEIKVLKEALAKLEIERDAGLLQYNQCLERISNLEATTSLAQDDAKGLSERASKAEIEAQNLKQELSRLEAEKEAGRLRYKQCLEMISALENKISLAEEDARMLNEQTDRAETEVNALKQALVKLNDEKEAAALRYEQCLETIAKMESEISRAQEDAKQLRSEILLGAAKLKTVEEHRALLERSNRSLREDADYLAQKIATKDRELSEKQNELEKLQIVLQDENSRFAHVEATLQTLQKLHSQSQEEQQALALELQNRLEMLKNMEICNRDLKQEMERVKEENQSLNELNNSSTTSIYNLQNENFSLKEIKEKLEEEVARQVERSNSLQQEVYRLKEEIEDLNRRYQALMEQLQLAGLTPERLLSSLKDLQEENSNLKEVCKKDRDERESLYEKLREMSNLLDKNAALESSLSALNGQLEGSRQKVRELQESSQFLQGEKSTLFAENATILSQLKTMTENMQKLLEKNAVLENSLSGANVELEGLRAKSKTLEEFCQFLKNEKSYLLNERGTLVSQLENVEKRLQNLENRFAKLEEKYADLQMEKESTLCQVEELRGSLSIEQKECASYMQASESRLADLENHVHLLREETKLRKKEFEEELDRAINAQVEIFILQKFVQDLEGKNLSLLLECQKHVEKSKLSDKLISELETENLEQQVEAEFLLDEIEKLRAGIYHVFRALQFDPVNGYVNGISKEQISFAQILDNIEDMKSSLWTEEDEKQRLVVENSVLLSFLEQLRLENDELVSEKKFIEQGSKIILEQHVMLQKDKHELLETNRQLSWELAKGKQSGEVLKAELETEHGRLVNLQGSYMILREESSELIEENKSLLKKFSDLKEEKRILDEENNVMLEEVVTLSNFTLVLKNYGTEKADKLKELAEGVNSLHLINSNLEKRVEMLGKKMEMKEAENLLLNETVEKLNKELHEVNDLNDQLNYQIVIGQDFLKQKATELSEAEQKLKATHNLNAELCRTIEELKQECEESRLIRENIQIQLLELSKERTNQKKEIEDLLKVNENLESEVGILHEEIEEGRIREENLSLELQDKSNEFELWEAEASSFYFDLQISAIHEVLLENKVHELTGVCESLEVESAAKSAEIEEMKEKVGCLESDIGGLRAQLSAYIPIMASLKDDIASLERNALLWPKFHAARNQQQMVVEMAIQLHEMGCQEFKKEQNAVVADGVSDLQEMRARIKAVEKAVVEEVNRLAMQESLDTNVELEVSIKEGKGLTLRSTSNEEKDMHEEKMELGNEPTVNTKSQKIQSEISEAKNGILMKDIPLDQVSDSSFYGRSKRINGGADDQMLQLWESAEQDCSLDPMGNDMQKQAAAPIENATAHQRFKDMEQKSQNPSSELEIEKELGVDKLEVSTSTGVPTRKGSNKKILERLASDAQKLTSLQASVQDLRRKMEMKKKRAKGNDPEYERVKRQLQEVEAAVVQSVDINEQLTKDIEDSPSSLEGKTSTELEDDGNVSRKRVTEQARKGSEKIGRLQFEVQSIQYVLLKLENEKKSKGKNRFSQSKTGILLRDFIYSGKRSSRKRKKACFCGCMRPSTNGE